MTKRGFTGLLAIAAATAALVLLFFVIGNAQGSTYDGGDGGSTLPACSAPYWGFTINLFGYRWYCAVGANHWVIR